jgi:hypothetical protein
LVKLNGEWAFDGGYMDNAPVPSQPREERARTLVLLTRHYPGRAECFQHNGRTYWQPSRPVPVSTWDCTAQSTVREAFDLGYDDARRRLASQSGASTQPSIFLNR